MSKNEKKHEEEIIEEAETEDIPQTETASEQKEEQSEKFLRLAAEYENYRKRTAKEKNEAYTDAYSAVVCSFLPMLDNLDRAIEYEPENEGVKLLIKQLKEIFDKLGVKEIETENAQFNPELHEAIMHETNESFGENLIVQTFQKGYMLKDKIIRHAMVKVVN